MVITYFKDTGEITAPIMTSNKPLNLADIFSEKAEIFSRIYDVINVVDNMALYNNIFNYYVDIETKELKLKETFKQPQIQVMEV